MSWIKTSFEEMFFKGFDEDEFSFELMELNISF